MKILDLWPMNQRHPEMLVEEGLITMEQLEAIRRVPKVVEWGWGADYYLLQNAAIIALQEHLITPEQVAAMPMSNYVEELFNNVHGINALRAKLITPEQIIAMASSDYVKFLFLNVNGIDALREGLITPEQVAAMPHAAYLLMLFDSHLGLGIYALRKHVMNVEDVASLNHALEIPNLIRKRLNLERCSF